jgi:hypothetical protein
MPSASNKCEPVSKILTTGTNTHTHKKRCRQVTENNKKSFQYFTKEK